MRCRAAVAAAYWLLPWRKHDSVVSRVSGVWDGAASAVLDGRLGYTLSGWSLGDVSFRPSWIHVESVGGDWLELLLYSQIVCS